MFQARHFQILRMIVALILTVDPMFFRVGKGKGKGTKMMKFGEAHRMRLLRQITKIKSSMREFFAKGKMEILLAA
jgi:hypothetical protein